MLIVEVKNEEISFHDIYQVKGYAELYDSQIALLISDHPIREEIKRILQLNPKILESSTNGTRIRIAEFASSTNTLTWFPSPPIVWSK